MSVNIDNEYIILSQRKADCNDFSKTINWYWVVEIKEAKKAFLTDTIDKGLPFIHESEAERVCRWLNNELERKVDEKIEMMFRGGEIVTPFDFLEAWNNKCEERIVKRFNRFKNHDDFMVKCHFDSDLLVLSNVPHGIDPVLLCGLLNIPYDNYLGASTFLSRDLILNVSKVKEMIG
ncbi:hypothetical protein [Methanobrevibacter sp.]